MTVDGPAGRGEGMQDAVRRKGSLRRTVGAVGWSFFGVRKGKDLERDIGELNPLHVVVVGVVLAALFVAALVAFVNWVIASGVAA